MCGKCTELFDHHCPFLNNCLGMRNYKYFLVFVFSYFMFLLCVIGECIRTEIDYYQEGLYWQWQTFTLYILVLLNFPIITYQVKEQCKSLFTPKQYMSYEYAQLRNEADDTQTSFFDERSTIVRRST